MPFRMGAIEIGLILLMVVIIFGVGKLPRIGEGLGKSVRAFRQASSKEGDADHGSETRTIG